MVRNYLHELSFLRVNVLDDRVNVLEDDIFLLPIIVLLFLCLDIINLTRLVVSICMHWSTFCNWFNICMKSRVICFILSMVIHYIFEHPQLVIYNFIFSNIIFFICFYLSWLNSLQCNFFLKELTWKIEQEKSLIKDLRSSSLRKKKVIALMVKIFWNAVWRKENKWKKKKLFSTSHWRRPYKIDLLLCLT